jgi:hypothetical protein
MSCLEEAFSKKSLVSQADGRSYFDYFGDIIVYDSKRLRCRSSLPLLARCGRFI